MQRANNVVKGKYIDTYGKCRYESAYTARKGINLLAKRKKDIKTFNNEIMVVLERKNGEYSGQKTKLCIIFLRYAIKRLKMKAF